MKPNTLIKATKTTLAQVIEKNQIEEQLRNPRIPNDKLLAKHGLTYDQFKNMKYGVKSIKGLNLQQVQFLSNFYNVSMAEIMFNDPKAKEIADQEGLEHWAEATEREV